VHLFLALLHGVKLQKGWMQPQQLMKNLLPSGFVGTL
jgi:hypothetical protein